MWSNRMYTYPVREAFRFHFNEATAAPATHEENRQAYTYRPAERRRDTLDLRPFMSERGALEHAMAKDLIRKEAPFGTLDTPNITMKIVGSIYRPVLEHPVQQNDQFVQGSRLQAIQQVADKPNHLDPRTFGDNPGGYYNKDVQQQESLRPTTLVNKRPDSKDVARQQYHPLPAIQANRTRNDMSTVFEAEQWTDNRHPSLAQETEYKQNYMLGDEEQSRMDNLFGSSGEHQHDSLHVSDQEKDNLFMLVPRNVLLPVDAIKLSHQQEETLCKLICSELKDFDEKELRDVYVECSQHDKELRGFCGIEVLDNCLRRHRACLSDSLRLTGAQFVDHKNPGKVNYEKILSFIGSALKMRMRDQFRYPDASPPLKREQGVKPETPQNVKRSKGNKYYMQNGESMKTGSIYRDREVAKLLRMVEQELSNNSYFMDWTKWMNCFCERDRDHRDTLSSSQIKDICYDQRLPLSDSLINHILSLCEDNNRDGQYRWNAFLDFLNRVRPSNTGLPIPVSKRPLEYAKHYPEPVVNWPRTESDTFEQQRQSSPRRQYDTGRRDRSPSKDMEQTRGRSPKRNIQTPKEQANRKIDGSGYQPSWQQHNSPRRSTSPPPARRINERVPDPRDRNYDPRNSTSRVRFNRPKSYAEPQRVYEAFYGQPQNRKQTPVRRNRSLSPARNPSQVPGQSHPLTYRESYREPIQEQVREGNRVGFREHNEEPYRNQAGQYVTEPARDPYITQNTEPPIRKGKREPIWKQQSERGTYKELIVEPLRLAITESEEEPAGERITTSYRDSYREQNPIESHNSYDDRYGDDHHRHRGRETFRDQGQSYRDHGQESYRDQGRESYRDHDRSSQQMNRDDQIRQLSNQLKHLESKYHVTRDGMHSHELPWLDRFLKMAKALYNSDVSNRGSLPRKDVMEIVRQYNDAFSLDLDMTRANMVAISPDNLDKSGNIILRPFLANLTGDSGITKKSYH